MHSGPQIKASVRALVEEFTAAGGSRDVSEAARSLQELGVPGFHHEVC